MVDIDPQAALPALGYPHYSDLTPVRGGWDTAMWRFRTPDGAQHTLRVHPSAEHATAARREQIALAACAAAGIPAPRLEAAGHWNGLPTFVLTWCPGQPLFSYLLPRPWAFWRLGLAFGKAQARIHAVAPPDELKQGAPLYWLARVGSQHADIVTRLLAMNLSTSALIHLDFQPLNVLTDGKGITAILDWKNVAAGDPRADFARTAAILGAGPIPPSSLRPLAAAMRRLFYLAWRRGYESQTGPLMDIAPFMAWAAATVLTDMGDAIGRPQVWAKEADLQVVRRWLAHWKQRAGFP